jgi:hypothetical protein
MRHYRFYELGPTGHITAGYSVDCISDADAMRAACRLLQRAPVVEIWEHTRRVAHLER